MEIERFPREVLVRVIMNFSVQVAIVIHRQGVWIQHTILLVCALTMVTYEEKLP